MPTCRDALTAALSTLATLMVPTLAVASALVPGTPHTPIPMPMTFGHQADAAASTTGDDHPQRTATTTSTITDPVGDVVVGARGSKSARRDARAADLTTVRLAPAATHGGIVASVRLRMPRTRPGSQRWFYLDVRATAATGPAAGLYAWQTTAGEVFAVDQRGDRATPACSGAVAWTAPRLARVRIPAYCLPDDVSGIEVRALSAIERGGRIVAFDETEPVAAPWVPAPAPDPRDGRRDAVPGPGGKTAAITSLEGAR